MKALNEMAIPVVPIDDAWLVVYAPVRLWNGNQPASVIVHGDYEALKKRCINAFLEHRNDWSVVEPSEIAKRFFADPLLFESVSLPNCFAVLELREQALERFKGDMALVDLVTERVDVFCFDSGTFIVAASLRQPGGWSGSFDCNIAHPVRRKEIGERTQTAFVIAIEAIASTILDSIDTDLLIVSTTNNLPNTRASRKEHLGRSALDQSNLRWKIPYMNFIVGGEMHGGEHRNHLSGELRHIVQPDSPAELDSQSPDHDEFVWLGSVYGVIFVKQGFNFKQKLQSIVILCATYSGVFDQLVQVSLKTSSHSTRTQITNDLDALLKLEERIERQLQQLVSPTATYVRKFRILGGHIYEQWEFDKMFQQVKFELGRLKLSEERRLRKSAARATKVTNAILLLMPLLALVSILNDALSLFDRVKP